ncbi:MAG: acetyl-CoA carboxylase biotin carboxylase subunit [Alphaproteobacteria bacterium]|jgi:acetyl-CoA carboxylase biotin carboxylase subunit
MFRKVLIANRGEIALRVIRACRELGIATVAVHSTADNDAMFVRLADESICVGPPAAKESYMNIPALLTACDITGAEAIHPGYGFLSENAAFADILDEHGITLIGPKADHIRIMGDKISAKITARKLNIPTVPGSEGGVDTLEDAQKVTGEMGYPVIIKAAAGGGGRGMHVVLTEAELESGFKNAKRDAAALYSDDSVYIEKYLTAPRHIEIQVMGDKHGNAVHLGERDCSLQRRHQKVVEEAPSPVINAQIRQEIGEICAKAMRDMGYVGAGTIEFLYEDGKFYFIEMNTRIQVEHPITEEVTGMDLVREQILVAAGYPLSFTQEDIKFKGHAIECRINAENPKTFVPSPGTIEGFHTPGGLGVRVDSGIYAGYKIPPYYDSLLGKLIVHGRDRPEALMRLSRCLREFVINGKGIHTTLPLFKALMENQDFLDGNYDIKWLEKNLEHLNIVL